MNGKFEYPFTPENCIEFSFYMWGHIPELAQTVSSELIRRYKSWEEVLDDSPILKKEMKTFLFEKKLEYILKT